MVKHLVWAGYGVRLHGEASRFRRFIEDTGLEVVTTWTGADLLPTDHPQNIGIVGISGQPGANKAVFEAEKLLVLGSSMSLPQTSTVKPYAPKSIKQIFHGHELKSYFDSWFNRERDWSRPKEKQGQDKKAEPWAFKHRKDNRPPLQGSYAFNWNMTRMLPAGSIMVVDGGGTALYTGFQSSYIKEGSRLICSSAMSAMGSGLPEAVGASFASPEAMVTCLIGDGSFMLNLQELQTIRHHNLPIKVFVVNNGGYLAIKQTQTSFLEGRLTGVCEPSLSFPEVWKIAQAFDIPYCTKTDWALEQKGPVICEWICPKEQKMVKQAYKQEGDRFVPQTLETMAYE